MIKQNPISYIHKCDRTPCKTEVNANSEVPIANWTQVRLVKSGHMMGEFYLCPTCSSALRERLLEFDFPIHRAQ
jgi:hypothetical protein